MKTKKAIFFICVISLTIFQLHAQIGPAPQGSKSSKITDEINLNTKDLEVFKEKTKQKINELQNYIIILANKDESREKRDQAEKNALKLFIKDAMMETSSKGPDGKITSTSRPMKEYFYRLKTLPYRKVVIEFYDVAYVSDFKKAPDGNYYATGTIFQKFTGFDGDNIVYTDISKKTIEIILTLEENDFYKEKQWTVYLGNISVSETK